MSRAASLAETAGLRPTSQRVAIIRALEGKERPVTAQALHGEIGAGGPGLATIYRTLRALAGTGLAETFDAGEGEVAYKLCQVEHHHHLICDRCGQVETIPSCEVEDWAAAVARRRGFTVSGHRADVYGLCERCRRRSTPKARSPQPRDTSR
jgi:Fur family transcriptional regulator, ferric uptake regulator